MNQSISLSLSVCLSLSLPPPPPLSLRQLCREQIPPPPSLSLSLRQVFSELIRLKSFFERDKALALSDVYRE